MPSVPNAYAPVDRPYHRLHNPADRNVIRQRWRPRSRVPNLANLVERRHIHVTRNHRIELGQTIEITRLRQKIVASKQLSLVVRTQTKRSPQRETCEPQISRSKARPALSPPEDNVFLFDRNEVRY